MAFRHIKMIVRIALNRLKNRSRKGRRKNGKFFVCWYKDFVWNTEKIVERKVSIKISSWQ